MKRLPGFLRERPQRRPDTQGYACRDDEPRQGAQGGGAEQLLTTPERAQPADNAGRAKFCA